MSYYNLSSVPDSKLYKKISFFLNTTNKKELELQEDTLSVTSWECTTNDTNDTNNTTYTTYI